MKEYSAKNVNPKRLLEQGDLDIRGVAAQNKALPAIDYFSRLEEFMDNVAQIKDTLLSISKLDEDMKALKELEAKLGVSGRSVDFAANNKRLTDLDGIKKTLTGIGYGKLNFDIDNIIAALKKGDTQLASKPAVEAYLSVSALFDRIKNAYSIRRFESAKSDLQGVSGSLQDLLGRLDYEESHRKLRILAVDDVAVVLHTITSVLSPYYEVFAIKSSTQVEKFLENTTPELFLLDIEMNDVNGFELVPLIRRFEKHKNTPIIFLTGNASYSNLKDAIALGACDFITKPINKDILLEKIGKNIVRKKAY